MTKLRVLLTLLLFASPPLVERASADVPRWIDNDYYKISIDARARFEAADIDGFRNSESYNLRTRLGVGTKDFRGFSGYVEGEGTWAVAKSQSFDGVEFNRRGQSVIADPQNIELNRGWLQFQRDDGIAVKARGGRQRIVLDDARFIGNVAWRQNEQTFDAALGETNFGVDRLTTQYFYLWDIRRIFGDRGRSAATQDFHSDSHLIRAHYAAAPELNATLFAYLLDFKASAPALSSNSYGFRLAGRAGVGEEVSIGYLASYAYQRDAAENLLDYEAHYAAASLDLDWKPVGRIGIAYELLGSDGGNAVFVTPLATAHKFNGFADAFLNNGGPGGLQDLNLTIAPRLPYEFSGRLTFHEFWSDTGNRHLGREIDAVLSRPLCEGLSALTKFAWFDGSRRGPAERWRFWLQLTFQY